MKTDEGWFKIKSTGRNSKSHYFKSSFPLCNTPFDIKLDKTSKSSRSFCKKCLKTLQTYNDLRNKVIETFKGPY